ncbi:MAG: AraC family transcriptional regulator [Sphingobacteriales bacterium]|nr:MAG: AraC family transcriptional regulator [Sphingobacteriales bacterium]
MNVDFSKHNPLLVPLLRIRGLPPEPLQPIHRYGLLLAISILAFTLKYFVPQSAHTLALVLSITSCVGCGLAWLLTRELFNQSAPRPVWPPLLVGVLFVITALLILLETWLPEAHASNLVGLIRKFITLLSSTVLLLPLVEATEGIGSLQDDREKRFRWVFAGGYGLLLVMSLSTSLPLLAAWQGEIKIFLAAFCSIGAIQAVQFRSRHPLAVVNPSKPRKKTLCLESDPAITAKIKEQLEQQQVFLDAEIKVADLAQLIDEQEYKVTQAITGDLQFRNFNQMINSYRIEHAKKLLSDPNNARSSILTIAMDSGFNSVGPFNRAFRALVGQTPSEYRNA